MGHNCQLNIDVLIFKAHLKVGLVTIVIKNRTLNFTCINEKWWICRSAQFLNRC